ncbi:MAG: DUF4338 domain-containing protein, partial [Verrucomicrobia bacterium]|nr:DUF4338 domain-containing protein [Verrucomicrobiota bacterium]
MGETADGIQKERKKENKRLDFCFDWGMAIPLLLPKLELPGILDALEVHLVVAPEQIELWNSLVCEHHYLKNANLVGEQVRYALSYQGQWVALLGWSAASLQFKDREAWLGWSNLQRRSRLHLLAQNSRFVVLVNRTQQTSVKPPFWERSNRKLDFVSVAAVCDACWLAAR